MALNLAYPHAYDIEIDPELPGSGYPHETFVEYPAPKEVGRVCMTIRVSPEAGESWIGRFWMVSGTGKADIFSCITETTLCVVAAGSAYIIPILDPTHWTLVEIEPVVEACRIPGSGWMVFAGFYELALYSGIGRMWATDWLGVDGIKLELVDEHVIHGLGYECAADSWLPFTVDVSTGDLQWG